MSGDPGTIGAALVRRPTASYADCIRADRSIPIDVGRALEQHAAYRKALAECGLEVRELPEEPEHPDACFVEDTAVVLPGTAILTRPGAPARRGETSSVEKVLRATHDCRAIRKGTVDGGDVLVAGKTAFVGLSARTDADGAEEFRSIVEPAGIEVRTVRVGAFLHLKSRICPIGDGKLLQVRHSYPAGSFPGFEIVETDEPAGGCLLALGRHAVVSAAAPGTAQRLRDLGLEVHTVDLSEFHAGDGGVTCLSLILR